MSISSEQFERAIAAAEVRETQGYFARVKAGDQRAASLFVRLVAGDLNPSGKQSDYGWLSKMPGESQVDGYAEDAICFGADPTDRQNVIDMVNGAGAPGASIGGAVKERREHNKWVKPKPLTAEELAYLLSGGQPIPPQPPAPPQFPYPDEGALVKAFQDRVKAAYMSIGRIFPDPNDSDAYRHFSRYGYSCRGMDATAAADKHIKELREQLGAPVEP